MKDAEYLFKQTSAERKRTARGAFNRKCGSKSKKCTLPSDHMTKKERDAMNGEVNVYRLNEPVKWPEFKKWPEDIQRQYLLLLREKFVVDDEDLGEMFGVARPTVSALKRKLGISGKRGGRKPPLRKAEWYAFLGWPVEKTPAAVEKTPAAVEETPEAESEFSEAELDILRLAELLVALKGSGAKLTVEVTL